MQSGEAKKSVKTWFLLTYNFLYTWIFKLSGVNNQFLIQVLIAKITLFLYTYTLYVWLFKRKKREVN